MQLMGPLPHYVNLGVVEWPPHLSGVANIVVTANAALSLAASCI